MAAVNDKHRKRYVEETRELFRRRVSLVLLVWIFLFPLLGILDYMVAGPLFRLFFLYRLGCSGFLILLYLFYRSRAGRDYTYAIAVTSYAISGITLSLMCVHSGGYELFYSAGVVLVAVTFNIMLPLSTVQAGVSGLMLLLVYVTAVGSLSEPSMQNLRVFFSNCFFYVSFVAITVLQCREDTLVRMKECRLKEEMDSLAERLSYYAHNLEAEVDKRVKALEESELRYRELYENIIDIVVLVDRHSKILMANPRFYEIVGIPVGREIGFSFMNLIAEEDTTLVEEMFRRLRRDESVNNFQFKIISRKNKRYNVECNARGIYKDGSSIGFQMVIRDITVRKKLEQDLLDSYQKVQSARNATILGLAKLAEYRDADTGAHLERIREYSEILARELSCQPDYAGYITEDYIEDIYNSSILHDIGKVGIPDSILLKPDRLDTREFEVVKRHCSLGGDALSAVEEKIGEQSFLSLGKEIAYSHHEKWDGSGYPEGLKGEHIPLSARIVALADVYDALTSKRVYKDALSHGEAAEIIVRDRGTHFAPDVVDAFLAHEEDFIRIREEMFSNPENNLGHEGYAMQDIDEVAEA